MNSKLVILLSMAASASPVLFLKEHSTGAQPQPNSERLVGADEVGSTSSSRQHEGDFFNPGDDYARGVNLIRVMDTAKGDGKIHFPLLIDNIVSSDRANGPAQASVGLGIRSVKPDFLTSRSTQETDGLYVQTKTGLAGDTSGVLIDAVGIAGGESFVNMIEGSAGLFDKYGRVVKKIRYQGPSFNQAAGGSFGTQLYAEKGVHDHAILIDGSSKSDFFTNFIYASTGGANKWRVTKDGNEYLDGALTSRAVVAGGQAPGTDGGSCGGDPATGGNAAGAFKIKTRCATGSTLVLRFSYVSPNGWVCVLQSQGSPVTLRQVGYSTTGCTIKVSGGQMTASDIVVYQATAF